MRENWGTEMAMVFQDPMTSLNPVMKIGRQITESLRYHLGMPTRQANDTALALLKSVGIPEPERRLDEYPHQLSGGMRQRVTIAIALACGPKLLFADEPTTALDVTVQAQILDLLPSSSASANMAMILVTHDLGVVAGRTDEIAVMYAGQIVEKAPTRTLFAHMKHAVHRGAAADDPEAREPEPHAARKIIAGRPPDLVNPPRAAGSRPAARTRRNVPGRGAAARRGRDARPRLPLLVPGRHRRRPRGARTQPGRDGPTGAALAGDAGCPPIETPSTTLPRPAHRAASGADARATPESAGGELSE